MASAAARLTGQSGLFRAATNPELQTAMYRYHIGVGVKLCCCPCRLVKEFVGHSFSTEPAGAQALSDSHD